MQAEAYAPYGAHARQQAGSNEAYAGQPAVPNMPSYQQPQQNYAPMPPEVANGQEYILGTGDRIRLTVYGEAELSGDYEVGSTGIIALPLIGDVPAKGYSLSSFEQAVRARLAQGYLKDPRVSAQVTNYRPFFILGEVAKPGSYPYVNNMTVVNAVALAGGYTYRANKNKITIVRASDPSKAEAPVSEAAIVMPGDIIRVPERFF